MQGHRRTWRGSWDSPAPRTPGTKLKTSFMEPGEETPVTAGPEKRDLWPHSERHGSLPKALHRLRRLRDKTRIPSARSGCDSAVRRDGALTPTIPGANPADARHPAGEPRRHDAE